MSCNKYFNKERPKISAFAFKVIGIAAIISDLLLVQDSGLLYSLQYTV